MKRSINLQAFYPKELRITETIETSDKLIIKLGSHTHSFVCPSCGVVLTRRHATYPRRVQDLPILGNENTVPDGFIRKNQYHFFSASA